MGLVGGSPVAAEYGAQEKGNTFDHRYIRKARASNKAEPCPIIIEHVVRNVSTKLLIGPEIIQSQPGFLLCREAHCRKRKRGEKKGDHPRSNGSLDALNFCLHRNHLWLGRVRRPRGAALRLHRITPVTFNATPATFSLPRR